VAVVSASAFSPAAVGNVASGFDLIGHCIEGIGDTVTAKKRKKQGQHPSAFIGQITGVVTDLPTQANENTATRAVTALLSQIQADFDVELDLEKGIPLASGLGGSAASATAALVATNALLEKPLPIPKLYPFALYGEAIAAGKACGDNVGPQLLGGLVLATDSELIALPVPMGLSAVVIHPNQRLHTAASRASLQVPFSLDQITAQQASLAQLILGLTQSNMHWIGNGLVDHLVEPIRKQAIDGFDPIQIAAKEYGALGGSISGAGPSVFAWFSSLTDAHRAAQPMRQVLVEQGLEATAYVSPVGAPGATVLTESR